MRRREFLRIAATATVCAALPMVAFAAQKKPKDQITFDDIKEMQRIMQAHDVPERDRYVLVNENQYKELLLEINQMPHYEGFTFVEYKNNPYVKRGKQKRYHLQ